MQIVNKSETVKAWVAKAPENFRDMVLKIYEDGPDAAQEFEIVATVTLTADEFTLMAAQFQAPNETMCGHPTSPRLRGASPVSPDGLRVASRFVRIIAENLPAPMIAEIDDDGRAVRIGFEVTE